MVGQTRTLPTSMPDILSLLKFINACLGRQRKQAILLQFLSLVKGNLIQFIQKFVHCSYWWFFLCSLENPRLIMRQIPVS